MFQCGTARAAAADAASSKILLRQRLSVVQRQQAQTFESGFRSGRMVATLTSGSEISVVCSNGRVAVYGVSQQAGVNNFKTFSVPLQQGAEVVGACCITSLSPAMMCSAFATSSSILHVRSSLNEKILSVPGLPQGLVDLCMCSTPEHPAIVLAVASQPRGGCSGVTVFAFTSACLRSAEAAHVRSRFFKMPFISPEFSCFASSDPSTSGGLLLRYFTVTPPPAGSSAEETTVTFISTTLPLHDVNETMKSESMFSISTMCQVMTAATSLHGGGCLHALAFSDGKAQILSASGSVAASARVFESSAPTAVSICVPMGLIAWSSAGSCCITDLSLQPLGLYSDLVTGMSRVSSLQGIGASMSMCRSCSWIVHRSGGSSATCGSVDSAGGGGNSGCDVVAAVFGLASGVCSVMTLLLPIPYDRAPQPSDLVETYLSQGQLSQAFQLWLLISCCGLQSADAVAALHVSMCSAVLASITMHPLDSAPQCAQAMRLLLDVQPPPAVLPLVLEMRKNLCMLLARRGDLNGAYMVACSVDDEQLWLCLHALCCCCKHSPGIAAAVRSHLPLLPQSKSLLSARSDCTGQEEPPRESHGSLSKSSRKVAALVDLLWP